MSKFSKNQGAVFTLIVLTAVLLTNGCSGDNVFEPQKEDFQIISFTGEKIPDINSEEYQYKQEIKWTTPDGVDVEYAIKIETTNQKMPEGLLTDDEGWVYYSLEGSPYSAKDDDMRTIWHQNNSFAITFNSQERELPQIISKVYLKYRSGSEVSEPISKRFRLVEAATRIRMPWGLEDEDLEFGIRTTGEGVTIRFQEVTTDIFIQGFYAHYFMYRLNIIDSETEDVISSGEWFSTMQSYDIREISLDRYSQPRVRANNTGEFTQIEAYVVTRCGVEEEVPKTGNFRVVDSFKPQAMIFPKTSFILGSNHYSTYKDPFYSIVVPNRSVPEGVIYGMPFFTDSQGRYSALLSPDMEMRLSYGWKGKYVNDDPQQARLEGQLIDSETGNGYYGKILKVDVSLNNQPLPYSYYENHPDYHDRFVVIDNDQTGWLRMPVNDHVPYMPTIKREHLNAGENTLKVRVMDSQRVVSEIEELKFYIFPPVPREQKIDVLVIHNSTYPSPAFVNYTQDFYEDIGSEINADRVDFIDRTSLRRQHEGINLHPGSLFLSSTDLEPYKLVIWQSDNPTEISPNNANIPDEYEVLNLYMRGGGNMIVSGGSNVRAMKLAAEARNYENRFFHDYFGLTYRDTEVVQTLSNVFVGPTARQYFIGASADGFPINPGDIDLEWEHPYIAALGDRLDGLAPITYFDENRFADAHTVPFYGMVTTVEGRELEGVTVAVRRVTADNSTYIFGFPLSYMQREQVVNMLNEIISEIR